MLDKYDFSSGSQSARVNPASSYLASNDKRVLFGLGSDKNVTELTVIWPGGGSNRFSNIEVNHFYIITQGGDIFRID